MIEVGKMFHWLFGDPKDRELARALCEMVKTSTILHQDISRLGISEMVFRRGGNSMSVSWYLSGRLRSLSFNGVSAPLGAGAARSVLSAAKDRAETEFQRNAEKIMSDLADAAKRRKP